MQLSKRRRGHLDESLQMSTKDEESSIANFNKTI